MRDLVEQSRERFVREVADHEMTILHEDGVYRHLLFKRPDSSMYWFELVTVPGALFFQGDGDGWTFRRTRDMFEFFRGERINPQYWAEKLTSNRDKAMRYEREVLADRVKENIQEELRYGTAPRVAGLATAVGREVLAPEASWTAADAHRSLDQFEFYINENDRHDPKKRPDFQFSDTWEWDLRDYDWWFLWSLHAIVWGIDKYDVHHGEQPRELFPRAPKQAPTPPRPPRGGLVTKKAKGDRL